ncbi:gamma-aminobutyric acid type B receptor subunit 2-like [Glandiceps talaboti]
MLAIRVILVYFVITIPVCLATGNDTGLANTDDVSGQGGKIPLTLIGLMSFEVEDGWSGGGVVPAVEMAVEDVNRNLDILSGYELRISWDDDQCVPGKSVEMLFKQLTTPPVKLMILGVGCSSAAHAFASTAPYFNLMQVGATESSPKLSDTKEFPSFIRITAPDTLFNDVRVSLLLHYGWTRIATLYQNKDFFSTLNADLVTSLEANNITVITADTFSIGDPSIQVSNIKKQGARIIALNAYIQAGKQVMCEAYKQGLYGGKYVWLLLGWYDISKWVNENDTDCSYQQLYQVVEGSFIPDFIRRDESGEAGISGMTFDQFEKRYLEWPTLPKYKLNPSFPQGYDAVWAVALTLNETAQRLADENFPAHSTLINKSLENFHYGDQEMTDLFYKTMKGLKYHGVTGEVFFDDVGNRRFLHAVQQIQDGEKSRVAIWHPDTYPSLEFDPNNPPKWQGGKIPLDGLQYVTEIMYIPFEEFVAACVCSGLCVLLALGFLHFNVSHMKHPYIKMSSPRLNNVIIFGCILAYVSVILFGLDERIIHIEYLDILCSVQAWTLSVSFTCAFGSMFAKTWRVHSIWTGSRKGRRLEILDSHLFGMVAVFLVIDAVLLLLWQCIDPFFIRTAEIHGEVDYENDVVIQYKQHYCESDHHFYWLGAIYVTKGLMLVFGCFLAYETRTVTIPGLNDSRYIGMSVYNVVVLCILGVTISLAVEHRPDLSYGITAIAVIVCATVTLSFLFVPKIRQVHKDPTGNLSRQAVKKRNTDTGPSNTYPSLARKASHHELGVDNVAISLEGDPTNDSDGATIYRGDVAKEMQSLRKRIHEKDKDMGIMKMLLDVLLRRDIDVQTNKPTTNMEMTTDLTLGDVTVKVTLSKEQIGKTPTV